MDTILNVSRVTDYSGETPVAVDSNPVTTVINRPQPVITRVFYQLPCDCCCNCCNCCDCCCDDCFW